MWAQEQARIMQDLRDDKALPMIRVSFQQDLYRDR